ELLLRVGESWLPPLRDDDPPIFDDADVYRELENHGFPQLVALQRETGKQALLAALVLLEIKRGNRDAAFEAWARLRHLRVTEIAGAADWRRYRRSLSIKNANNSRLAARQGKAAKVVKDADALLVAHREQREI